MAHKRRNAARQNAAATPGPRRGLGTPGARRRKSARRRGRFTWGVAALGAALLLVSLRALPGLAGGSAADGVPRVGTPAPSLKVKTLDGPKLSLADLRGKVVLVNFWATWCPPCRAEMPGFESVWREKQKDGFVVLGLSAGDDGPGEVAAFLSERGITYPVGLASPSSKRAFGGVNALPASFLVDKRGVVRRTVTGVFDERLLRQDVRRLLAEN